MAWRLYIDETGRFDRRDRDVAIVGLLLCGGDVEREDAIAYLDRDLRSVMDDVFPSIPYPPHAIALLCPSAYLAAWVIAPCTIPHQTRPGRIETRLATLQTFVEAGARRGEPAYMAFLDACMDQRTWGPRAMLPKPEVLAACDERLAIDATADLGLLERIREEWHTAFRAYLEHLHQIFGPWAFVVGACSPRGDEPAGRYLRLFPVAIRRVADLLARADGAIDDVEVFVAEAPIGSASGSYVQLTGADALRLIAAAGSMLDPSTGATLPTVRLGRVTRYLPGRVEPGLVLADYCANRLCLHLGSRSWPQLRSGYASDTPFAIERAPLGWRGAPVLPAPAAHPERADRRWWGADQAARWRRALDRAARRLP